MEPASAGSDNRIGCIYMSDNHVRNCIHYSFKITLLLPPIIAIFDLDCAGEFVALDFLISKKTGDLQYWTPSCV